MLEGVFLSTKIYKSQTYRPYKIEVYGLQDNYIGTLQSYDDSFIGQVSEPKITLSDDGTQTLTCSIPRFYIDPKTNKKEINPRWEDINNGVLAENTRILKVFINEEKVYPFIVDKIVDKRDSHFAVYKEITANGLAFAELGKVGLKLELTSDTVEADYEKDNTVVPTINYWLDKVFPNEKDESGKVIKWNTPWCYEIRMDWRDYTDKDSRESTKVYEDAFIDAWKEENGELVPTHISKSEEKARYLSSEVNSNKYNITQTIAETFGVFCYYEYKCANNGQFIGEYIDENGRVWRGKKVVFCNRAIKTDNPFYIDYQKNLQAISRTCDSSEIYTKLVVDSIQSGTMTDGYITIANTAANPLADDFILNFDYLYSQGAITDYQKEYIENYKIQLHKINSNIAEKEEEISELEVETNDKDALAAGYEKTISSAKEELVHYQTLRDNEVTNAPVVKDKDNAFSVVFVNSDIMTEAQIRLEGVAAGTIRGYIDYEHENQAFDSVVPVSAIGPIVENDENIYCVLDEYGYAASLYTGKNNPKLGKLSPSGYVIYLDLQYSPYNKYQSICEQLENTIALNAAKKAKAETEAVELQAELDAKMSEREALLTEKDKLNNDFESVLGPALREGHWTPSDYKDIGETCKEEYTATTITFDTELFDEEENGYYYISNADIEADKKTYYDYINVSNFYPAWRERQSELTLSFSNPSYTYKATTALGAGKYYVIYKMKYYVFELPSVEKEQQLTLTVDGGVKITIGNTSYASAVQVEAPSDAANITNLFENINNTLGELILYNNAGFVFSYLKSVTAGVTSVIPVLLLNKTTINYHLYKTIKWKLGDNSGNVFITARNANEAICYPRMIINKKDVNYDADTLTLEVNEETLEKYSDYSILLRKGMPHITLKPTDRNSFYNIFSSTYSLTYQVSQANKMLYRDALEVAKENSQPKYSYEISISQTPDDIEYFEIGQLCRITDSSLGVQAASGYISQIELSLDAPKDDSITIQNYKTKFEDLFATITASSEAMKQNKTSYDMAANSFTVGGLLEGSILQDTFNNNKIDLEFSNTQVLIDDINGIALTNIEPYSNGVYGQVIMRGGGIFLSNRTDENGERVWTTGITPNGINASMITTGQLDTNLIRVFAGNNLAFQWNSEGLYAYKKEGTKYKADTYVRYSDKGLQFFDNGFAAVDLGWNGLAINTQEGALTLTGENGLSLYDGAANSEKTNHFVRIGRFDNNDGTYDYGLRLYKTYDKKTYSETLVAGNDGQLWLKDYLSVGGASTIDNLAGISGLVNGTNETVSGGGAAGGGSSTSGPLEGGSANNNATDPSKSVRFWAGSTFANRNDAPFRVLQDGSVFATNLTVGGGSIVGNYTIDEINDVMNKYDSTLISSAGLIYNKDTESETTTLITYFTLGGINTVIPKGYTLQLQEKNLDKENSEYITIESAFSGSSSIVRTGIVKDENKSYRSIVTTKEGKQIIGETISFTAVENGKNGTDGVVPAYEQEWYAVSSDSSTWPEDDSSEWTTSYEEIGKKWSSIKPYLWKREKFTTDTKWRHSLMAAYGVDGVGISAIKSWYLLTISDEMPGTPENSTLGWMQIGIGAAVLKTTVYKPYLWTCTSITFDNGRIQYETPYVASIYSFSLKSIENQYLLTSTKTAPSSNDTEWKTYTDGQDLPETTSIMPYLWNREKLTYDEITNLKEATTEYQYRTEYTAPHIADDYNDGTIEIQNWYYITNTRTVNNLPPLIAKEDEDGKWFDEGGHWELEYDNIKLSAINPVLWEIERKLSTRTGWTKGNPRILTIQGQNGQSVGAIVELYRLWHSATVAPDAPTSSSEKGWEEGGGGMNNWTNKAVKPTNSDEYEDKQYYYLWNCEGILLTNDVDGKYEYTIPQYAYSYDDKVLSRTEYYQVSNDGVKHPAFDIKQLENYNNGNGPWHSSFGEKTQTSAASPYLWNVALYRYVADGGENPEPKEWQVIGTHGKDGQDAKYLWVKFSIYHNGKDKEGNSVMQDDLEGMIYMGMAKNKDNPNESSNADDYEWQKIVGDNGKDGASLFTWTVFSPDKKIIVDDPDNYFSNNKIYCNYVGLAYNRSISESEAKKDTNGDWYKPETYTWYYCRGEKGDKGDKGNNGDKGADGEAAILYQVLPSTTSYTRSLTSSYSPSSISFDIQKIVGANISTLADWGKFKIIITNQESGEATSLAAAGDSVVLTANKWNKGLLAVLKDENDTTLHSLLIPANPDNRINELAEIDGDNVYAAEGKVRAKSIAGFSITAAELSAGAIQTGGISSNSSLYLYSDTSGTGILSFTEWAEKNPTSATSDKYLEYVAEKTKDNYEKSSSGKMALTRDGVEIKAQGTTFQLDAGGIRASAADFKSITMDGQPIFGGANVVISYTPPLASSIASGKTIWIQPSPINSGTEEVTVTSVSMNLRGGTQNGSNLCQHGSDLSESASNNSNYPFSLANIDVLGDSKVQINYKLSSLVFYNNSTTYLSSDTIGPITIILSYDKDRTNIIYSGTTTIVRNNWNNGYSYIPPKGTGYTGEITWTGDNIFTQENKANDKKIYLYFKTDNFETASDGAYVWLQKGETEYTLTGTVENSKTSTQADENTIDWRTCKVYYTEK